MPLPSKNRVLATKLIFKFICRKMHISGTSKTTAFKKSLVLIRTRKKRQKAARRYNLGRFAAWHIGKGKCFLALVAPLPHQLVFQFAPFFFNSFFNTLFIF